MREKEIFLFFIYSKRWNKRKQKHNLNNWENMMNYFYSDVRYRQMDIMHAHLYEYTRPHTRISCHVVADNNFENFCFYSGNLPRKLSLR